MYKFAWLLLFLSHIVAQQDLVLEPASHNLGKIPDNQDVYMTFVLKNQGQQQIVIEKVETSCGCTSATPSPQYIAPGKISEIKVSLNPQGKQGSTSWQMKVFTNSFSQPILYASFEADVLRSGIISDKFISFGEFRPTDKQEKKIWISPEKYPDFKIISVTQSFFNVDRDCFDIKIIDDTYDEFYPKSRPAKRIDLSTQKDIPYGRIDGEIVIKTNIPENEEFRIPVVAKVAGDIGVRPDTVSFGILKEGHKKERQIYIYHREGQSFEIKNIQSPWKDITVSKEVMIPKQYYKITVVCHTTENIDKGEIRDYLIVETTNKDQQIIKIPLQGYVIKK